MVTTFGFNAADQVTNTTVTAPGLPAQSTTSEFDELGWVWRTVLPDNTSVTNEYHPTGELKKTTGSRTYPVEYTYDYAGRMKTMKTWQIAGDDNTAAVTTWNYDPQRGWLTGKVYADPNSWVGYTASPAGRPATRTWARGVTTTYGYNAAGDLATVHYSDPTPGITNQYDRLGRLTQVQQGAATLARLFDLAGNLLSESYSGGPLSGLTLTNTFDYLLRRASVSVNTQPSSLSQAYGYDAASRLAGVSAGSGAAGYSYLASAPLVQHTYFTNNGSRIMTTTKAYDGLNRLTKIETINSQPTTINSFSYQLNSANQRTAITNADSSRWAYQYDSLGQVTSGKKYWDDNAPVAGQQFEYDFDHIGNRNWTKAGGDQNGSNLRQAFYTNNALNQITSRRVSGVVDVIGTAATTATVAVNDQAVTRQGEYFWRALTVNNTNGAVWQAITNAAVVKGATTNDPDLKTITTNSWFFPQTPEVFSHDADGNLTQDGRWNLTWDSENRLTSMEGLSRLPTAARQKLAFTYDSQWRRTSKVVSNWTGTAWSKASEQRFVYDGWNLLAILDENLSLKYSFTWGLDLSGSLQGAGGVGGLLAMTVHSGANAGTYFPAYDGNGNIVAYASASTGTKTAEFEYGPFGELIRATGPLARECVFLFSTKFYDWETGLCYYGYRYYDPSTGRWRSRDPSGEQGSPSLYQFALNNSINTIDTDGRFTASKCPTCGWYQGVDPCKLPNKLLINDSWDAFTYLAGGDLSANVQMSPKLVELAKKHINDDYKPLLGLDLRTYLKCCKSGTTNLSKPDPSFSIPDYDWLGQFQMKMIANSPLKNDPICRRDFEAPYQVRGK